MADTTGQWRDSVFDETHQQVSAPLATRLTQLADETRGLENWPVTWNLDFHGMPSELVEFGQMKSISPASSKRRS
jgi:hypothetical protein